MQRSRVPQTRIAMANDKALNPDGAYVLYWMIAARRTRFNFGLQRAHEWSRELQVPLVVFEAVRSGHRWACERFHAFLVDGMADNARRCLRAGVAYYPYVEPEPGAGSGLLESLAARARVVVTDTFPCFFLPRMVASAAARLAVRVESVDSNGLLPLAAVDRAHLTAFSFRRFLQRELPRHWDDVPQAEPLPKSGRAFDLPRSITARWPAARLEALADRSVLAPLALDRRVGAVSEQGGPKAARERLKHFATHLLRRYVDDRNDPDVDVGSGLSPSLHFGHLGVHEVWHELRRAEAWEAPERPRAPAGKRTGWWSMSPSAEAFLDQIVTWRELGYTFCQQRSDYDRFEGLPAWSLNTLRAHASDPRPYAYTLDELEGAGTHDVLWNAAQTELRREGRIHNYLRMLWGKKILEWSPTPETALEVMVELNNRYALDGRDPNSYSGIFWCLGRFDRPWGPERPIFGTVRYMSSANTARKLHLRRYLARYGPGS